jgi:twitching motility protein PilU
MADHIRKGDVHLLKELMSKSTEQGMQTFDQALFNLYMDSQISYDSALSHADSANDLRLMIKLSGREPSAPMAQPAAAKPATPAPAANSPPGLSLESNDA